MGAAVSETEPPAEMLRSPASEPGFAVEETADGVIITGLGGITLTDGELKIPDEIDGKKVVGIGERAFRDAGVKTLTFVDGVELDSIGDAAFQGNEITGTVKVPAKKIGENAFAQNKIKKLELSGTTEVGKDAFRDNEVESLTLDPPADNAVSIAERAFINNRLKGTVDLTKTGAIGDDAFATNDLREAKVGENTTLGAGVFKENNAWVKITTPEGAQLDDSIATAEYDSGFGQIVDPVKVVVRYVDENGEQILPDETLGDDLTAPGPKFQRGKEATHTPREVSGYQIEPDSESITFTPDEDGFVITAKYTKVDNKPVFTFPQNGIRLRNGEEVTAERVKRGVTAKAKDGTDLTKDITVDVSGINSKVPGFYDVVFSVTDSAGNETVEQRKVSVGIDWGEYEFGGGWQIKDFEYSWGKVTGFSASGKAKLEGGNTTLWIPPSNLQGSPVTSVGSNAFERMGLTGIGGTWQNIVSIDRYAFAGNSLQFIPESWDNVAWLGYNSFWGNQLTALPSSWGKLKELPSYVFQNNKIAAIPESWENIKVIGDRALDNNQIQKLPDSWGDVVEIGSNSLINNSYDKIPHSWGNVKKIGAAAFFGQKLKEIPEEWGSVEEIGGSVFSNNQLVQIPESWGSVKKIGGYVFDKNQIKEIPDNWSDWTRIPAGLFRGNQLTNLPESWGSVSAIESSAFEGNELTSLPDSWENIRELGGSAFESNQITEIPQTWANLESLDGRVFANNEIETIPESWGKVKGIPYLGFGYNRISQIPDSWGEVDYISGFAFAGNSIKTIPEKWGSITNLHADALANIPISSLPYSWENIRSIGRDAFSSLSKYTDTTFEIPTENLTQKFIDDLNRSALPKTITLLTTDRNTPPGLVLPKGIKVNPVKVTVRFVNEQGAPIGPKSEILEAQMGAPLTYQAPAIYGYATPGPVAKNLGTDREQEIEIVYSALPKAEVPTDTNITLSHNNQRPYYIGSDMTGNVRIDRTGYATEPLHNVRVRFNLDSSVYDLDSFDITTTSLGIDRETIKREGSSVSFVVPAIYPSMTLTIPFRVKFKKGTTPSKTDFPIVVTLVDEDGKAVAQSNVETFQGYYGMPSETITVPGENTQTGEIAQYDQTVNTDDPANPVSYVSDNVPGQDVQNRVSYNICVNGLDRNVSDYSISVPIPEYRVHEKSQNYQVDNPRRLAEFDPEKNPGWTLSANGREAVFTGNNKDSRSEICRPLVLGYPGAVEGEKFSLPATVTMTPTGKPQSEPYIVTSQTHANYFGRSVPPPGELLGKRATGNHGGPSNNYFYDNAFERNGQFPWTIGYNFEERAENVSIRDFGLDERMYYDTLTLPNNLGIVDVYVFDKGGATLYSSRLYNSSTNRVITFEKNQVIDAAEIRIVPLSAVAAKMQGSVQLTSRLKDPSSVIFEKKPEVSKVFNNSASVEVDGKEIAKVHAKKTVRAHKQEIAAFKTQRAENEVGDEVTNLITGDFINYTVGFVPNESFAETITNIEVVDLLPKGIDLDSVSMTAEFSRLPGAYYEVIDNYLGSGHTAVIFRASSASRDLVQPTARLTAGIIKVKINLALDEKHLVNDVFVRAQNTGLANKVTDERLGSESWSKAMQETIFEPAAVMETTKRIRAYDMEDKAGPWLPTVTTTPGTKLDYRLRLTNGMDRERSNLVVYDVFPHVGDQGIPKARQSDFANDYDPTREPTLPRGYHISYYNGEDWPVYDGTQQQTDEVLSRLNWESSPSKQTKAVRIVQDETTKLEQNQVVDFILPFTANAERLDAHGNPPEDLLGKRAYNTFFYKDSMQPELLEGSRVENLLKARPISIKFKKVKDGTQNPLAGATFELRNSKNVTVASAISDKQGIVHFANVAVLSGYKVVETKAPQGFDLNSREYVITDQQIADGYSKNPAVIDLPNFSNSPTPPPPAYGKLEFKKLNPEGKPLPGTVFRLSGYDARGFHQTYKAVAAADGTVGFGSVSPGKRYELAEETPIRPYQPIARITPIAVKEKETTYLGDKFTLPGSGEVLEHVIVNDKVQLELNKLGVTDDRLYNPDGTPREFGSFGAIDGQRVGAEFQLLDFETGEIIGEPKPSRYGGVTLKDLIPGKLYKLLEIKPPEGYEEIPHLKDGLIFQVSASGQLVDQNGKPFPIQSGLYVPNRQKTQTSMVKVQKVDQDGNNLAEASFVLERLDTEATDPAQAWKQVAETVTDTDGIATFAGISQGRYRVMEKQAPLGYSGKFVSHEFIVQRTIAKTFQFHAVNTRIKPTVAKIDYIARGLPDQGVALEVSKKNPGSSVIRRNGAWEVVKYLPGAEFDLREGDKGGTTIQHIKTGEDGKAEITVDLDPAKSYVLVETQAPEGYAAPEVPLTFKPETLMRFEPGREKGMFTVYAPNARETGRIVVSKTDKDSGLPLLDGQATFSAQKVDKVTDGSEKDDDIVVAGVRYRPDSKEKVVTKKTSTSGGVATFDKLKHGTWIVRETEAAKGFTVDDAPAVFEVNKHVSSHTFVFANQGDPEIKLTKFINDQDANNKLTAAWLAPNADTMDVKLVVENTGKAPLRDVMVTDRIEDAEDQYINEALSHAVFSVTRANGTVEDNVPNGMIVLNPGDKAETTLEGMASPEVNKMHRNDATVVGTWRAPNDVTDADPAHAYRLPVGLPLPATGDQPWLIRFLVFGGVALLLAVLFAARAARREA